MVYDRLSRDEKYMVVLLATANPSARVPVNVKFVEYAWRVLARRLGVSRDYASVLDSRLRYGVVKEDTRNNDKYYELFMLGWDIARDVIRDMRFRDGRTVKELNVIFIVGEWVYNAATNDNATTVLKRIAEAFG